MIFTRNGLYLSARYTWSIIPHVFYVWQFGDGFEIKKSFYKDALRWTEKCKKVREEIKEKGFSNTLMESQHGQKTLFQYEAVS